MPKIGIMGGTFNPIHYGHLVSAEEAYHQFGLEKVVFMPASQPPHKEDREIASEEDRYLMTIIATAGNNHFAVSRLEIERKGLSYTIDTVKELRRIHPGWDIFFITGADAILEILTWKDPEQIVDYCSFIAATRPGYSLEKFHEVLSAEKNAQKLEAKVHLMEIPALAISSTYIRERVQQGKSIKYLLPDGVADYIYENGLYKD